VSHPGSIDVTVRNGRVRLAGDVLAQELDGLLTHVRDLAGARRVKVAVPKAPDASGRPLDKLSDAELDALAAEAERTLRSTTQ